MNSKPILFSAPMVRAILDGGKTQTRRVVNPQPPKQPESNCHPNHTQKHPAPYLDAYCGAQKTKQNPRGMGNQWCWWQVDDRQCLPIFRSPYGSPGDQLWVRETWAAPHAYDGHKPAHIPTVARWHYAATEERGGLRWRPSIHMPRAASRITLEITGIRAERLQDISKTDAWEEGCNQQLASQLGLGGNYEGQEGFIYGGHARDTFAELWESINGTGSWDANPWVWVVSFERVKP